MHSSPGHKRGQAVETEAQFDCIEKRLRNAETALAVVTEQVKATLEIHSRLQSTIENHNKIIYIGMGILLCLQALNLVGKLLNG